MTPIDFTILTSSLLTAVCVAILSHWRDENLI